MFFSHSSNKGYCLNRLWVRRALSLQSNSDPHRQDESLVWYPQGRFDTWQSRRSNHRSSGLKKTLLGQGSPLISWMGLLGSVCDRINREVLCTHLQWLKRCLTASAHSQLSLHLLIISSFFPSNMVVLLPSSLFDLHATPRLVSVVFFFRSRFLCSPSNIWAIAIIGPWSNWRTAFLKEEPGTFRAGRAHK